MLQFDATITLGMVIQTITLILGLWMGVWRLYSLFDKRLTRFEAVLCTHTDKLAEHSARMNKQDEIIIKLTNEIGMRTEKLTSEIAGRMEKQQEILTKLTGEIQRVVGRMEAWSQHSHE